MRIITLEEHVIFPELVKQIPADRLPKSSPWQAPFMGKMAPLLADVNETRIKSMDENGITIQVLSVAGPGAELLDPNASPAFATQYNDAIAEKIAANPDRFKAFAHLPMNNPDAAAKEFERAVKTLGFCGALINGLTNDEFLDDAKYTPVFEVAQQLDVPIYLHPGLPPERVEKAYYQGLPKYSGNMLSISGWGWHSETALHVLRLIVAGIFDKYPKFKLIIGHMGEMLPMMMARCDRQFRPGEAGDNQRGIIDTLRQQVHITTSGLFTQPPLKAAIETFGIDNVMFSVDYPFSTNQQGKAYLDEMDLAETDMEKLAHGNADKLLKLT